MKVIEDKNNDSGKVLDPTAVSAGEVDPGGQVTINKSDLEKVHKIIAKAKADIKEAMALLDILQNKKSYKDIPGVEGVFTGYAMVDDAGVSYEVPANYAAKSKLVYGDRLKKVEDEGKTLFKQIDKVPRKLLEGVVSRKEGKWFVLTEIGSYELSERAAEFNNLAVNDKVKVFVPEAQLTAPFATLEKVITHKEKPHSAAVVQSIKPISAPKPAVSTPKKPVSVNKSSAVSTSGVKPTRPAASRSAAPRRPSLNSRPNAPTRPVRPVMSKPAEPVENIPQGPINPIPIGDDDLR